MAARRGGYGTVFKMTPSGTVTVLHVFTNSPDGAYPRAALLQAANGTFYGTTSSGGDAGAGAVQDDVQRHAHAVASFGPVFMIPFPPPFLSRPGL